MISSGCRCEAGLFKPAYEPLHWSEISTYQLRLYGHVNMSWKSDLFVVALLPETALNRMVHNGLVYKEGMRWFNSTKSYLYQIALPAHFLFGIYVQAYAPHMSQQRHRQSLPQSHMWVEVTHCASTQSKTSWRKGMWFYVKSGTALSLNLGRTTIVDQSKFASTVSCKLHPVTERKIYFTLFLLVTARATNRSISRHHEESVRQVFNRTSAELLQLDSIQIINHFEEDSCDAQHEVLLLSPVFYYGETRTVEQQRRFDPVSFNHRLACGRYPHLRPCDDYWWHQCEFGSFPPSGRRKNFCLQLLPPNDDTLQQFRNHWIRNAPMNLRSSPGVVYFATSRLCYLAFSCFFSRSSSSYHRVVQVGLV